jgi:nicotinate-nucleotide pyrophosphorylase (carboxylating)
MTPPGTPYHAVPRELLAELADAGLDPREVYDGVVRALAEDVPTEDTTSLATVPADAAALADLIARADGVLAGVPVAELVLHYVVGDALEVHRLLSDGGRVRRGDVVLTVAGPTRLLLTAERTALNYLCHLSGIATVTARWVGAVAGTRARVRDTRKTVPGHRHLAKYAVRCGGGVNHRGSLSDQALVKDNHVVAAGGVVPAYRAVLAAYPGLPVQVEVTDLDQLRELLEAGAEQVLLDNMSTEQMAEAVRIAAGRAALEASGGLGLDRAREVAGTGVDFLAVGALTHSAPALDVAMDLRPARTG